MSMSVKERLAKIDSEIGERQKHAVIKIDVATATGTRETGMNVWVYGSTSVVPNTAESYRRGRNLAEVGWFSLM
jgi:hypothetical protein